MFKKLNRKLDELKNLQCLLEFFGKDEDFVGNNIENKFEKMESEILYYEEQIQPSLAVENEIYEGLETFIEWLETIEDVVTSVERAESCELFDEAYSCLQV